MKIGFIGLGRMGHNMVLNLLDHKHQVVAHNRSPKPVKKIAKKGAIPAYSLQEVIEKLPERKIIFIMITAGRAVDAVIKGLLPHLKKGDILIDAGNSYFKDSVKRYTYLKKKGIHYLDAGTSGGIKGARYGACMMIGGEKKAFSLVEKTFKDLCVKNGYGYMGKSGAGHFVKMVHNGIEYGMLAAIAEGLEVIHKLKKKYNLDIEEAAKVYSHGSIIESRLMDWAYTTIKEKQFLKQLTGRVPKGETEEEMMKLDKLGGGLPILRHSIIMRQKTRKKKSYAGKITSGVRNIFGGHKINKK